MSIKVQTLVWNVPMNPTLKLVALCLADYARDDGTQARPSQTTIAIKTGLSKVTVGKSLRALVEMGVLRIEKRPTNRRPAIFVFDLAFIIDAGGKAGRPQADGPQAETSLTTSGLLSRGQPACPNPLDTSLENHYGFLSQEERQQRIAIMRRALRSGDVGATSQE